MNSDETVMQPTSLVAQPEASRTGLGRWQIWVPAALVGVAVATLVLRSCSGGAVKAAPVRAVPGAVTPVKQGAMDVNFTGLGTVVTLNTVTVKSRVDGQLMRLGFREGQMVREGELLAEIDPRPFQVQLLTAEGQMAKDAAALKNARHDLERFTTLANQGILSKQAAEAQGSSVDQFEAAVKMDRAQVESAKLNLVYSRITAPVAGRVGLRTVDPGNMVHATDATGLAVITPVQPINVVFTIPADQLQKVLAAVKAGRVLTAEAYDRDLSQKLATGTFQAMDNQIDPATGTVKLKALFKNEDLKLFPNQFVNIRMKVDTLKDAVMVPTGSLQRSPNATYLYVVKADGTADMRTVDIEYTDGEVTAVRSGVKAGETVVTEGMEKLRPGAKVTTGTPDGGAQAGKGPKKDSK